MDSERRSALLAIGGAQPPHEPYAAVAETHVGVVLFVGDRAYKLKKPVALGFVDFTLREARAVACRREVELNARLAPDVYLGVADLVGPDGNPCDHWVVMRRLPAARRLSRSSARAQTRTGRRRAA
jgi:aminoglycoside phosphotransferase family enzyme